MRLTIGENIINNDFYSYYDTHKNEFTYTLLNNSLDTRIIKILDKYSPDIDENCSWYLQLLWKRKAQK